MKLLVACLVLAAFYTAHGQDVVEVGGEDEVPGGEGGGGDNNEIDIGGAGQGSRDKEDIPDDGLLPNWCAGPVGKKCDVEYDIGVFDSASASACLYTCQMKSCLNAQYHNGQCQLSSERCEDLVPGEGTNYYRLKEGEEGKCPDGTSPTGLQEFIPINQYCKGVGVECPGKDIIPSRYTPTIRQCISDCNVKPQCLTVHYREKICHLRGTRCTKAQLIPAPGAIDLYRRTKGEECTPDRPPYVEEKIPYTGRFCMIKDKACPGHNLYRKPQNINPLENCLIKCNKIKTCGSVDFVNNKCSPKNYRCSDEELVDQPGAMNLMRMQEGEKCPGNREPPPVLKPWSGRFCQKKERECVGFDMENMPVDAETVQDCLEKCVKSDGCATAFFNDGKCTLKDKNCEEDDLKTSTGTTYYRLRAGEACPEPSPPPTCPENSTYDPEAPACPNTCEDRDAADTCPVESASGCYCDSGYVKAADSDKCIPVAECGCKDDQGNKKNVGDTWSSPDCSKKFDCQLDVNDEPQVASVNSECGENQECDGAGSCKCVDGYEMKDGVCKPVVDCGPHSTFDPKASTTPNVCHHYTREAAGTETAPGCPCNDGFVLDKDGGKCVPYRDCGCKDDNGKEFPTGDEWLSEDCSKAHTCEAQGDAPSQITDTPNTCTEHATCKADDGRGECACEEGYTMQPDDTCKPDKECTAPFVYNPKGSLCPNTCRDPTRQSECKNTGPACECPAGHVLNDENTCIAAPKCPCYDEQGQPREVGIEWMQYDCDGNAKCVPDGDNVPKIESTPHECKENAVCDRESGFSQCVCKEGHVLSVDGVSCVPEIPPCEKQLRDRVKTFVDDILSILSGGCGSCSDTCQNPHGSQNCPVTSKICSCGQKGFLYDKIVGKCIPSNECGCYDHNALPHAGGSSWLSDDCHVKYTCNALGAGSPTTESEPFSCQSCDGAGVCSDSESSILPEPNSAAEAVQSTALEG